MSNNSKLQSLALKNGGQVVEDHEYMMAVKEGDTTVERSGSRGGKAEGVPIEQEVLVNLITFEDGKSKKVSSSMWDVSQYPDRKLGSSTAAEVEPDEVPEEEIPSVSEEIEMSASKHVTIETSDMEIRVEFEDVVMDPQSGQASIVYDPNKPCSLPMKGRQVRILADDLPPFSAVYEGVDFEIPRGQGLRLRLLKVCDD